MIYSEEFMKFLEANKWSINSVERQLSVGNGTLLKALKTETFSNSLESKISEIFPNFFTEFAQKSKPRFKLGIFQRNPNYVEPHPQPVFLRDEAPVPYTTKRSSGVPIYNTDFTAGDIAQFGDEPEKVIGHIDLNGFRKCIAFVYIKGSSMYPAFVAGDLIGIEPISDFEIIEFGQPYGIITTNGQRMVKIIRKGETSDMVILKSVNPEYDPIDLPKNKISKLFKVHGPVRDQWQ